MDPALQFPTTIMSGGQIGTERAALDFAIELRIFHGGFCAKGRVTEDGSMPSGYDLRETASTEYAERLWLNVSQADATVVFDCLPSARRHPETILAIASSKRCRQPFLVLSAYPDEQTDARELRSFIRAYHPSVLHVTGNRESQVRGIYAHAKAVLNATATSLGVFPQSDANLRTRIAADRNTYLHYPGGVAS